MRNLTIKRAKSFAACLAKVKIYIEDPTANDLVINNVPCRKLGTLKNNEEKTFVIGEEQSRIFVIGDKLSKNIWNEFYLLAAGQEDVYLTGRNKLNPANGNMFQFDNNNSVEVKKNRRKGLKFGILILVLAVIGGFFAGYFGTSTLFAPPATVEPQLFSESGMSITLTNQFRKAEMENYTVCYDSADVAMFALKEEFALVEGFEDYTLEEYGNILLENNSLSTSELNNIDGIPEFEFEYTTPDTNDTYNYFAFIYKSNDAFWLVQFATLSENANEYRQQIIDWAKSVSFE